MTSKLTSPTQAKSLTIMPITNAQCINHVLEIFASYFDEEYRPVQQGNILSISDDMTKVRVIRVEPHKYGIVTQDTVIHCTTGPVEVEKTHSNEVQFYEGYGMKIGWVRHLFHQLQNIQLFKFWI